MALVKIKNFKYNNSINKFLGGILKIWMTQN